jgi:hypothetical protein
MIYLYILLITFLASLYLFYATLNKVFNTKQVNTLEDDIDPDEIVENMYGILDDTKIFDAIFILIVTLLIALFYYKGFANLFDFIKI